MESFGQTLRSRVGPFPVWAWAGLATLLLLGYLFYRQKQSANAQGTTGTQGLTATQSNLGTVPISNLTTEAQPMPIQMGDTFVDVQSTQTQTDTNTATGVNTAPPPKPPVATPKPPAATLQQPSKPAPTKQGTQKTVTVCPWPQWCGSLWGIAQKEYGNGALWPQIYNANKAKIGSNPNLIHPGTTLVIPG